MRYTVKHKITRLCNHQFRTANLVAMLSPLLHDKDDLSSRAKLRLSALELYALRGETSSSVRDIAQHAGVAPGLVRHYYGSKRGLTRAVDDDILRLVSDTLDAVPVTGSVGEISAARDAAFERLLAERPLVAGYVRQSLLQAHSEEETLLDRLVDLTLEQTRRLSEQGFSPRRSTRESVFATVVRQVSHVVVAPAAQRVWQRLGDHLPDQGGAAVPRTYISVEQADGTDA